MSTPTRRETFTKFAGVDRGIPELTLWTHPKTSSVTWGDGSMRCYVPFRAALDNDAMDAALMDCWKRYKAQCSRRAVIVYGLHGCANFVPHAAAEEIFGIVRNHFSRALETMAECGYASGMTWEERDAAWLKLSEMAAGQSVLQRFDEMTDGADEAREL